MALLNGSDDEGQLSSGEEDGDQNPYEREDTEQFVDPDTVDIGVGEQDSEIDSDEAFGESDVEKFTNFTFRGSTKPRETKGNDRNRKTAADFMSDDEQDESYGDMNGDAETSEKNTSEKDIEDANISENSSQGDAIGDEEEVDSAAESDDHESDFEGDDDDDEKSRRAELRKAMNAEQKTVLATISEAAKADTEKGIAVKQQRKAFDSLLNIRIRLQKALIATNSIAASDSKTNDNHAPPYAAAEEAAIKLLNSLTSMRSEFERSGADGKISKKRKHELSADQSIKAIWQHIQASEIPSMKQRQATLEKWSAKVRGATANPVSRKLNTTTQQTIIDVLEEQLSNPARLIKRTKMPRSCAPLQSKLKITEDDNIYDDADFYQLLLKELVDQRMTETAAAPVSTERAVAQWKAVKEAKTKRNVDTKASKGRKMRFTVHEKLQNFMAPEDRASWEQDAIDRFFGTLLGQQMNLGEEEIGSDEEDIPTAEEALKLFRS